MNRSERNSAHELLRIIAMFIIVWYHLITYYLYFIPHYSALDKLVEAALPTMHIGVILFVLITGYYGIRPSLKGLFRLLLIILIYYIPLQFMDMIWSDHISNPQEIRHTLQFITNTPYWFIRTYLFLYLLSPILNTFLQHANQKKVNWMLGALALIAIYFGTQQGDPSLTGGKNIVNFIFLYLFGNALQKYSEWWKKAPAFLFPIAFIILNAATIILLAYFPKNTYGGEILWRYSFPYCSPLLIINATIFFLFFSRLSFHSKWINAIAASTFPVYLIHCQPVVHNRFIMPIMIKATAYMEHWQPIGIYGLCAALAFILMAGCILIDKTLTPVWKRI